MFFNSILLVIKYLGVLQPTASHEYYVCINDCITPFQQISYWLSINWAYFILLLIIPVILYGVHDIRKNNKVKSIGDHLNE